MFSRKKHLRMKLFEKSYLWLALHLSPKKSVSLWGNVESKLVDFPQLVKLAIHKLLPTHLAWSPVGSGKILLCLNFCTIRNDSPFSKFQTSILIQNFQFLSTCLFTFEHVLYRLQSDLTMGSEFFPHFACY